MHYMTTIIGLLVIVNPIGMAPIFVSLTENYSESDKRSVIRTATIAVTCLLIGSALIGESTLNLFGVSLPAFRVAGGILLLLMAISMLHAKHPRIKFTPGEELEAAEKDNIAIVPLAIPLLAGPGAISTTILFSSQAQGMFDYLWLIFSCIVVGLVVFVTFKLSTKLAHLLGKTGINIVTRLFGILLAAIGVEFITKGLEVLLPGLSLSGN